MLLLSPCKVDYCVGVCAVYFDDLTLEQLQRNKQSVLDFLKSTTEMLAHNAIFYMIAYGTSDAPTNAELHCKTTTRANKLSIVLEQADGVKHILRYDVSNNYVGVVEYMYAWLVAYIEQRQLEHKVAQIQQWHEQLIADVTLNYRVLYAANVYSGLGQLTDTSITINISTVNVDNVMQFMQKVMGLDKQISLKQVKQLKEMYMSTFEACIHPIELMHTCNIVVDVLKLHTRQVYSNVLVHVCPHRLRAVREGQFFVHTSEFSAIVQLEKTENKTDDTCIAVDDAHYACTWVVAPISNLGTRIIANPKQVCNAVLAQAALTE